METMTVNTTKKTGYDAWLEAKNAKEAAAKEAKEAGFVSAPQQTQIGMGTLALGVFFGNLLTAVLVGLVYALIKLG